MNGAKTVGLALAVLGAPLWTGCYTVAGTRTSVREEVSKREHVPQGSRIDLDATRSGTDVRVAAAEQKMCRLELSGTATPSRESDMRLTENGKVAAIVFAIGGGTAAILGFALSGDRQPTETQKEADERNSTASSFRTAGFIGLGLGLLIGLIQGGSPDRKTESTPGEPYAFKRWEGDVTPCPGVTPVPAQVPILASASFEGSKARMDFRSRTGTDGSLKLPAAGLIEAAAYCGKGRLELAVDGAGGSPTTASAVVLEPPAKRKSIEELLRFDPPAGKAAGACCSVAATATAKEECEEKCTRAAGAPKCIFGYRVCQLKAARAEEDPAKAAALCESLYVECLVGNGASRKNVDACVSACTFRQAADDCR